MNKNEIINYIKQNNGIEIAALQQKFNIPYKDAKAVIDELVDDETLAFESGVRYVCVGTGYAPNNGNAEIERYRAEARLRMEKVGRRLIKRAQGDREDENDDKDRIDHGYDDETDAEELRYKALKFCIEKNAASVTMLQRVFPVGYIESCKLIDWMEDKGFVSEGAGAKPRKVLITKEEFDKLYSDYLLIDDLTDDVVDERENKFLKLANCIFAEDEAEILIRGLEVIDDIPVSDRGSALQAELHISRERANRIIETLERLGILSSDSAESQKILKEVVSRIRRMLDNKSGA